MLKVNIQKMLQTAEGKILLDVAFELAQGQTLAVYGKSGVGKTTLLRLIAGLEFAQSGNISFLEESWLQTSKRIHLPPQQRGTAMVFQDFALFPNMTVAQNIAFGQKQNDQAALTQLLNDLGLERLAQRLPTQLSGGQKQRVALARALARQPQLLLLDEPLSALDSETRLEFQEKLKRIKAQTSFTSILVSHDISEIFHLADEVIVIDQGKITKRGRPSEVFLGSSETGITVIAQVLQCMHDQVIVQVNGQTQQFPYPPNDLEPGSIVQLRILPDGIRIERIPPH